MLNPKDAVDIADKLGILEAIKTRLIQRPDAAAVKLAAILQELAHVFELCDKEVSRFLSLSFEEATAMDETKRILIEFEVAALSARMHSVRAAVSRLDNIYDRYLHTWFDRLMDDEETGLVHDLFYRMGSDEADTLDLLSELTQLLSSESSALLDMLDSRRIPEAKARLAILREQLLPGRKAISRLMAGLFALEAEFIQRSGAV